MAANQIDLTTAATVAGDLGVSSTATIERIVTATSRAIATYCNRTFEKAIEITENVPGYGRPVITLSRWPILAISSITERGTLVDAGQYEVIDADIGQIKRLYGCWANTASLGGRITSSELDRYPDSTVYGIQVEYDAGYVTPGQNATAPIQYPDVTLPEDIQQAAIIVATQWYRSIGVDQNVQSESLGDWSVSYFAKKAEGGVFPKIVEQLLAPYVRLVA
jgi:hypothetical protein